MRTQKKKMESNTSGLEGVSVAEAVPQIYHPLEKWMAEIYIQALHLVGLRLGTQKEVEQDY